MKSSSSAPYAESLRRRWKPELRILGVDAATTCGDRQLCICVVTRGPLLVDGSFVLWWDLNDAASLARGIKSSPFYRELAAVVVSNNLPLKGRVNEVALALEKPVLLIAGHGDDVLECSGISLEEAVSLVKALRGPFGIEALRLALLLAPLARVLHETWKSLNQARKGEKSPYGAH